MELWLQILIGVGVVAVLAVVIYLWFGVYLAKQKNAYCRGKAGALCKSMAKRCGHVWLRDVRLPFEGKTVRVDHMVVGTFGVVLVNGYDGHGDLYGQYGDKGWYIYSKDNSKKKTLPNPMTRMENAVTAMRAVFAKEGVYNVNSVDSFIVFGSGVKLNISSSGKENARVLRLKQLNAQLHKEKYLMEAKQKVDVEKAVAALQNAMN